MILWPSVLENGCTRCGSISVYEASVGTCRTINVMWAYYEFRYHNSMVGAHGSNIHSKDIVPGKPSQNSALIFLVLFSWGFRNYPIIKETISYYCSLAWLVQKLLEFSAFVPFTVLFSAHFSSFWGGTYTYHM